MIKEKKKDFLGRFRCGTCFRWKKAKDIADFKKKHYSKCNICGCKRAYKTGDVHPITCPSQECWREKKKRTDGEIKLETRLKNEKIPYMDHQHFADFECFPQRQANGKFIVYAGGLIVAGENEVKIDIGEDSLEKFMERIFNLEGILWFFNGSKFDVFFIMEYLIQNKIQFNEEETVICAKQVLVLTLNTNKGKLMIKDLAKFFVGSLAYNCKSFGVSSSESKGEFDHDKIRSFTDVERHKEEIIDYLKLDVIALRSIYQKSAKDIADDHKLLMCKYVSLPQLSFAISSTYIRENFGEEILYRSCIANGELEEVKSAYFGGRVPVIHPIYCVDHFDEIAKTYTGWFKDNGEWIPYDEWYLEELANYNKEYGKTLNFYDIVSLYPSQMIAHKFPCGKVQKFHVTCEEFSQDLIWELNQEAIHSEDGEWVLEGDTNYYVQSLRREKNDVTNEIMEEKKIVATCKDEASAKLWINTHKDDYNEQYKLNILNPILNLVWKTKKTLKWTYRIFQVDLQCPKNLYIPFIMARNEKGRNIQNLTNKEKQWITGAEIIEAIILGYKVTKVYAFLEWDKQEYLFKDFIKNAYTKKAYAEKNTAAYENNKLVMNSNSGKHGQKNVEEKIHLFIGEGITMPKIATCQGQCIMSDETGELLAIYGKTKVQSDYSPYSVHLSVFILAYARVHMSRCTRAIDGYSNPKNTPIEGDTDSLVIPSCAIRGMNPITARILIGNNLGQLKDEMPYDILIYQLNVAPKTKFKIYITYIMPDGPRDWGPFVRDYEITKLPVLRGYFKSKGIKHTRDSYDPFLDYRIDANNTFEAIAKRNEVIQISEFLEKRKDTKIHCEKVKFNEPYFIRKFIGGDSIGLDKVSSFEREIRVTDRLTHVDLHGALMGWFDIECLFGGMVRNLKDAPTLEETGIFPDYIRRSISKQSWWENGKNRIIDTETFPFGISKPIGFED